MILGLMPYSSPHIWGKLKWIFGGSAFDDEKGMKLMDWFDFTLHGFPWVFLILAFLPYLRKDKV